MRFSSIKRASGLILLGAALNIAPVRAQTPSPIASEGTLSVIAQGFGAPDDLVLAPDGTIYFGDLGNGRLVALNKEGMTTVLAPVFKEPEGMVVMDDGSLIVVEQASNKLIQIDPAAQTSSVFYAVGNATKNPGIDNIARDPTTGDLLLPDAPTGRILRLMIDLKTGTKKVKLLASGFRRPTAIAPASDGTLYICDEYGQTIERIAPNGKVSLVARIPTPDDVILGPDGLLYVNSLRGVIWRIDPVTGASTQIVTGLIEPHGLIIDQDGNLIIADAKLNHIYRLTWPKASGI